MILSRLKTHAQARHGVIGDETWCRVASLENFLLCGGGSRPSMRIASRIYLGVLPCALTSAGKTAEAGIVVETHDLNKAVAWEQPPYDCSSSMLKMLCRGRCSGVSSQAVLRAL